MTALPPHPLGDQAVRTGTRCPLIISPLPDCGRFSLRIDPRHAEAAGSAFGLSLPLKIGAVTRLGQRLAVKLGPDEWFLLLANADRADTEARFAALSDDEPLSLVDISHREVGIGIEGRDAALLLRSAVAFDVEAMPVASGCRTIFDRAQIILLRKDDDRFRIEVWHSASDHVWHLLAAAASEIALGI